MRKLHSFWAGVLQEWWLSCCLQSYRIGKKSSQITLVDRHVCIRSERNGTHGRKYSSITRKQRSSMSWSICRFQTKQIPSRMNENCKVFSTACSPDGVSMSLSSDFCRLCLSRIVWLLPRKRYTVELDSVYKEYRAFLLSIAYWILGSVTPMLRTWYRMCL